MSTRPVAYVNGRYRRLADAQVSINDRGLVFADSVYEVWTLLDGRLVDLEGHLLRLDRSLGELRIASPMSHAALVAVLRETARRNRLRDGLVYLQVTRGVALRDHAFPDPAPRPGVIVTARPIDLARMSRNAEAGVRVVTVPEARWARCDIKSTALLPNVLAKQAAREAGATEAWFVDSAGHVTEGASTNAWIVTADGVLVTRDTGANILRGVTRAAVAELAASLQLRLEERAFSVAEALAAREAFITAATAFVTPVTRIDGAAVGEGAPGPVALRLRSLYLQRARAG